MLFQSQKGPVFGWFFLNGGDSSRGVNERKLVLKNPRLPDLNPVEAEALADSGSVFLCIPAHVQIQLGLEENGKKEVTLADGTKKFVPYVGPVERR